MGKDNLQMSIALRRNNNAESTAYGHYYPKIVERETLSQYGFAQHMHEHGLSYPTDLINGVITRLAQCIPELVGQGASVKLEGIGTFIPYVRVAKKKGGGSAAVAKPEKNLNPNAMVQGVYIRFRPECTKLNDLSSPAFKDRCAMAMDYVEEPVLNAEQKPVGRRLVEMKKWIEDNPVTAPTTEP
ncbi:MAG: hypothetical protein IJ588_05125 [Prevotella sp.]|nr:hypothetical protein [Prevotella sp.]